MNLVDPASAAVSGIFLFVVPGLVFLALLGKRERDALRLDEALFLSVAVSVMAAAWVGLAARRGGALLARQRGRDPRRGEPRGAGLREAPARGTVPAPWLG